MDVALWLRIFSRSTLTTSSGRRRCVGSSGTRRAISVDRAYATRRPRDARRETRWAGTEARVLLNEAWRRRVHPTPGPRSVCSCRLWCPTSPRNFAPVTADGLLSTTPLDADDGAPSSPRSTARRRAFPPTLDDSRRVPDSSCPDDAAVCGIDRGRIRIIRPANVRLPSLRYDGRVTALAASSPGRDDQAIIAMSTRKTIGRPPAARETACWRCQRRRRARRRRRSGTMTTTNDSRTTRSRERDAATASPFAARCAAAAADGA